MDGKPSAPRLVIAGPLSDGPPWRELLEFALFCDFGWLMLTVAALGMIRSDRKGKLQ